MKNFLLLLIITIAISFTAQSQNKLLWYTFDPDFISGDTVLDESGNGNNALMVNGANADSKGFVRIKDSAYLDVHSSVIDGLDDFTIYMRVYMAHLHTGSPKSV